MMFVLIYQLPTPPPPDKSALTKFLTNVNNTSDVFIIFYSRLQNDPSESGINKCISEIDFRVIWSRQTASDYNWTHLVPVTLRHGCAGIIRLSLSVSLSVSLSPSLSLPLSYQLHLQLLLASVTFSLLNHTMHDLLWTKVRFSRTGASVLKAAAVIRSGTFSHENKS